MAEQMQIEIDNLKCGGCARSILKSLAELPGVTNAEVDMEQQLVKYEGAKATRPQVADKLRAMGYPERGTLHGVSAGVANAKSFVSCAIGRIA